MKPLIRGSSMPLFMTCNPALLNPDQLPRIEQANEMALVGTLVHKLAEDTVANGTADLASLKNRLSPQDFERAGKLYRHFLAAWKEASKVMRKPQLEKYLEAELPMVRISGHIDVVDIGAKQAYILDYKAGRQHEDHYHQMAAYAYLAWAEAGRPNPYKVEASVLYLEDLSIHPYTFTADELLAWETEVTKQAEDPRYNISRKCANCPLATSCPAYARFVQGTNKLLTDDTSIPGSSWEAMTPQQRGEMIDRMYVMERAIDRAKLGLRNYVKGEGKGRVDIGGNYEMVLVEDTSTFLDTRRALPVVQKYLPGDVINGILRLPMDEVLAAVAMRAAKGSKTMAREELMAALEKVRAVVRYSSTRMWRRPKGEKVLDAPKGY